MEALAALQAVEIRPPVEPHGLEFHISLPGDLWRKAEEIGGHLALERNGM